MQLAVEKFNFYDKISPENTIKDNAVKKIILAVACSLLLSGCATWSHTEATKNGEPVLINTSPDAPVKKPEDILLTKEDITDKKYDILADLEVIVNKTTIFNADPTPAMVDQKLREEGAKIGADAVIQVRYGSVGVSFTSWGSLEGKGRAIRYKDQ